MSILVIRYFLYTNFYGRVVLVSVYHQITLELALVVEIFYHFIILTLQQLSTLIVLTCVENVDNPLGSSLNLCTILHKFTRF
jgi:hypothetical protein